MKYVLVLFVVMGFSLLSLGQSAKLWGVTSTGGDLHSGTLFCINNDGTGFYKIHDFDPQIGYPFGHLLLVKDKLWGMTKGNEHSGKW